MHLQFLDEVIYLHHRFHFCGSSYYSFNVYQLSDTIGFHFSDWNRFSVRARFEVNFKSSPIKRISILICGKSIFIELGINICYT